MVIVPLGKALACILWRKGEILKGERGKPTYWCMLFQTNSLLSFLVFFPFLSVFVLIFFFFSYSVFFFYVVKNPLFFLSLHRARQGPLYSACRDQCFTVLPLNRLCLVWVYLPTTLCDTHPCQTEADLFYPSVCRSISSCHDINAFSLHSQSMHPTVPSQIASFGWSIIPA